MAYIPLTQGKFTQVDDSDYKWLGQWKWHTIGNHYAARREWYRESGMLKSKYIYMHRVIAGTPLGMDTDHKNGDTFDNRRSNLRICTTQQNVANRTKLNRNTTGYKGVILDKKSGRFVAQIGEQLGQIRKNHIIGKFETAHEAGIAYEMEAKRRYGEFAKLELLGV